MRTLIKRSLLVGIGLLSMTQGKARQVIDELVKKGEIRRDEMESFIEDLAQRGEEERQALRKLVHDEITHTIDEMGLATKDDVQKLSAEIRKLEKS